MRWSWKIGRIAGIDLYVHATFFFLILWVVSLHAFQGRGLEGVVSGVTFILALFACVILHEFGHALTARRFGIPTKDITLLPIGGVSRFERMPDKPWQEFWVAIAGPLTSLATAAAMTVAISWPNGGSPSAPVSAAAIAVAAITAMPPP